MTFHVAISSIALPTLAVMAAWYPASQAERVNPVETLRAAVAGLPVRRQARYALAS